jgi:hypothetical protein
MVLKKRFLDMGRNEKAEAQTGPRQTVDKVQGESLGFCRINRQKVNKINT